MNIARKIMATTILKTTLKITIKNSVTIISLDLIAYYRRNSNETG